MTTNERRSEARYGINIETAIVTRTASSYPATSMEISASGIRIQTPTPISPGDQIALFLKLENEMEIRGSVLWTLDTLSQGLSLYHVGIHTESIYFDDQKAFAYDERSQLLEQLLPQLNAQPL